jgi:DNA-binding response OmpR family regulator
MNGQTIILLDDDVELRTFFATALESLGFAVVTASNSEHVVELIAEHRAVLLVTDLVMPDHEGMEGIFSSCAPSAFPSSPFLPTANI